MTLIIHNRVDIEEDSHRKLSNSLGNIDETTTFSNHFRSIPLRIRPIFIYFRSLILLSVIHSCGCLVPSVLSAFYFLVSLGFALWWALGKHFGRVYLCIIRLLQIYSIFHLLIIYFYQLNFIEEYLLKLNLRLVRLLGLKSLYKNSCQENELNYNWIVYIHPFVILTLYWITIYEYYLTRKYAERLKNLFLQTSFTKNNSQQHDTFHLHSITDLFWIEPSHDVLNEIKSKIFYQTNSLLVAFISFILSKAYMFSIISMLLWSITYHSYLTFIYLILACFIWLLPNTKYWCQFFSPFFSFYAYILLIINYINLLDLIHEDFLLRIHEIESFQINKIYGIHISIRSYIKCTIKFSYTLLLLLSLRQRTREISNKQQQKGNFVHSRINGRNLSSSIPFAFILTFRCPQQSRESC